MKLGGSVNFDNGFPSEQEILRLLRDSTGLDIEIRETDEGSKDFFHPVLEDEIEFFYHRNSIGLSSYQFGKKAYLFYAAISVLIELGGEFEYPERIPHWAKTKWRDLPK